MSDILGAVLEACERTPEAPAMTLGRRTLSFGRLRDRVLGVAGALEREGFVPGDRVLFSVRPGLDGICLALGIIAAGGTVVFADPGAGEAMFRARAGLADPRWVAAEAVLYAASSGPLRGIARRRGLELPDYASVVPHARHIVAGPRLRGVPKGALSLGRLLGGAAGALRGDPRGEALIIFTSGTTQAPKAVVHSRSSLGAGLGDFAEAVGFVPGERVLTDQLMVGIPALIGGAHWVLPPTGADPGARPKRYLPLLAEANVLFAVPAALDALLRMDAAAPRLRMLLIGGAPVLRPLLERARARFPRAAIRAIYGMTEILPVAIADGDAKLAFVGAGDDVGELMRTVAATVVDGELVLAGPGLALGYLGQPPLERLATGDLARLNGRRLVLAGRAKDMFIRGTTNVYPGLYEPVIASLAGVDEAALVGVPNEIGDDAIVLAYVGEADQASIAGALPGLIDAAVLPDRIVRLEALPRKGRSGKLDRAALAEALR
ncbi:class I adenylate-forming enzyme family protein [Leifsonia sp. H3M29-4]|uniref:class I adenylate-forming enzyme family protein n=1 Tax=Salinibacterium metalliresistens TaxID=3031321 RepID=UPI0023DB70AD|nr:class I adenylate-forming enzyme family protein [Salinibacterium metalliresistens]MDF1478033.1 class I adenylate-forming enzyme family protein [Salinibacterium metalliresistens]